MNVALQSRLENWKFGSALQVIDDSDVEERPNETVCAIVEALAALYGDCGNGLAGAAGEIVHFCVEVLLVEVTREPEETQAPRA